MPVSHSHGYGELCDTLWFSLEIYDKERRDKGGG